MTKALESGPCLQDSFKQAVEKAAQNPAQQPAARGRKEQQAGNGREAEAAICGALRKNAAPCDDTEPQAIPPRGLEQGAKKPDSAGVSETGGARSGAPAPVSAHSDPDLQAVVAAWPTLPEPVKAGILAMVKAAKEVR